MARESQTAANPARREFLKGAGAVTATALTIGFQWLGPVRRAAAATPATGVFAPNAFVRIAGDGSVTVIAKHVEMGQGAYTGIATVLAEELDADWSRVRVESAPADVKRYANSAFGMQGTGGSSAMANSWTQLREAGAKGRAMLVAAAAKDWKVPESELTTEKGVVFHAPSQRQATYGSLAGKAAALPVPATVALKDPKDFKLIGHRPPRVDVPAKVDGTAVFTLDVALPGMLVALLKRPPRFGGTVRSFDAAAASAVPGVVKVVQVPGGVAVVAKSFWAAKQGRDALVIDWDESQAERRSSAQLMAEYRQLADQPATPARTVGDARGAIKGAARTVAASFEFPYLAHAPMEPLDAVVKLTDTSCEIWAGDQFQTIDQANAARIAGLDPAHVSINTLYAGGSFGRRANVGSDYIVEAVSIAKAFGADGTPIKLQWTREDDLHGGLYRPMYFHKLEAGLNAKQELVGWRHVIVGQSIMSGGPFQVMVKNGVDPTSVEGAATIAYDIPNIDVELATTKVGVPVLWWRVVGSSHTTFAVEAFIDEVAHAAGKDPLAFRRDLLQHEPRMPVENYRNWTNEYLVPQSTAKYAKNVRDSFMVGALARLNNNSEQLSPGAKKAARELGLKAPSYNPFMNNVAQVVEIVHAVEESIRLIDDLLNKGLKEEDRRILLKAGHGAGAVDVPRGILFHEYAYDKDGTCVEANCIIPTNQNHANIQKDMEAFLPHLLDKPKEEIALNLEMLVRAYDPCISCSTHLLKVKFV